MLSDVKNGIRIEFYLYRLTTGDEWYDKQQVQLLGELTRYTFQFIRELFRWQAGLKYSGDVCEIIIPLTRYGTPGRHNRIVHRYDK